MRNYFPQKSLTVTAITAASPAVATVGTHGLKTGSSGEITFSGIDTNMASTVENPQHNASRPIRYTVASSTTLTLKNINGDSLSTSGLVAATAGTGLVGDSDTEWKNLIAHTFEEFDLTEGTTANDFVFNATTVQGVLYINAENDVTGTDEVSVVIQGKPFPGAEWRAVKAAVTGATKGIDGAVDFVVDNARYINLVAVILMPYMRITTAAVGTGVNNVKYALMSN